MAQQTIRLGLKIDADINSAKESLNQLHRELNKLQTQNFELGGLDKEFKEAAIAAKELQTHLLNATNKFGQIDIGKFAQSMKASNTSVKTLATSFLNAGKQGQAAFAGLANQIINAQKPALSFSNILTKMGTTLANNIRWQLSSAAINAVTGSIQEAWHYTKEMDKALTNIRVVTGKSKEEMDKLAQSSNKMAKELKSTTTEIVKGQLIYYQQGDSAELAAEKARITAMAANISFNSSQEEMAEYLTAIWNSYQVGENELELFVDKLSAVGAATATSMEEIATGMTKVAASANAVGVTYDQLNATIATISSTTRVSAESVGTAMKTIYARMGDLKVGKKDEDGITYGQVSKQMKQMGIDIADANGQLRDMGEVVEEIGNKWETFSKEEQQALVQAVAGKRQYTNLTALFENWDMYLETLEVSKDAMGTLQEQQDIWADSWEGASNRVKASLESLYQHTLDSDAFIGGANVFAGFLDGLDWVIEKSGGLESVLLNVGGLLVHIFNGQIAAKFADGIDNIRIIFGGWQKELIRMRNRLAELPKSYPGFDNLSSSLKSTVTDFAKLATVENIYLKNQDKMTTAQKTQYNYHKMIIEGLQEERQKLEETSAEHEKYIRSLGKSKTTVFKAGRGSVDVDRNKVVAQAFNGDNIKTGDFLGLPSKDINKMNGQVSKLGNTLKRIAKNYNIELGLEDDEQDAKKVRDALNQLIRELKIPVPDFNFNLKDDIQTSKSALETFTNEFKEMDTESTVTVGKVKQSFTTLGTSLGMTQKDLDKLFDGFLKEADDVEVNLGQITQKLNEFTAKKVDKVMDIIDPADEDEAERIRIALSEIFGANGDILNKNGQINSSFKLMGKNVTDVKSGIVGFTAALMSGASAGMSITSALDSFTNGDITGGIMGAASAVSSLITAFSSAGWIGLIISALMTGISLWQKYHKTAEEKIQDLNGELETLKGEIESLNGELTTTRDRINELQSKGTLSLVEQKELDRCLQQEASLERQVRLKEQLEKKAQTEKNTVWFKEQEKEKADSKPAEFTVGPDGQYLKRQGTDGGQNSTGYYYTKADHDEVIEYYRGKIDELNEDGIAYIENASSELEKNINSEILNRYTDLYKVLADEARSKGDLEGYADYIADTINEQIMYNPELKDFPQKFAKALEIDPTLLSKNVNELPASIQPGIKKLIDLGLITENQWADVINNFNNGILSLNADDFVNDIDWMVTNATKKFSKLEDLELKPFGKNFKFTNEQEMSLIEMFPTLTSKELAEWEQEIRNEKITLDAFYQRLKNKDFEKIQYTLDIELAANDMDDEDWNKLANAYGMDKTEERIKELKIAYKELADKGIVYAVKNAKGSIIYYDKTGKAITELSKGVDEATAYMIALNQELIDTSKLPNLPSSIRDEIIKIGQAAGWSNGQMNAWMLTMNTLKAPEIDFSTLLDNLRTVAATSGMTLATLAALMNLSTSDEYYYYKKNDGKYYYSKNKEDAEDAGVENPQKQTVFVNNDTGKVLSPETLSKKIQNLYKTTFDPNILLGSGITDPGSDNTNPQWKKDYEKAIKEAEQQAKNEGWSAEKLYEVRLKAFQDAFDDAKISGEYEKYKEDFLDWSDDLRDSAQDILDEAQKDWDLQIKNHNLSFADTKPLFEEKLKMKTIDAEGNEVDVYNEREKKELKDKFYGEWDKYFDSIKTRQERGELGRSQSILEMWNIANDAAFNKEQREQMKEEIRSYGLELVESLPDDLKNGAISWKDAIKEFGDTVTNTWGIVLKDMTREEFLKLPLEQRQALEESATGFMDSIEQAWGDNEITLSTGLNWRTEFIDKYSATMSETDKAKYLNDEKWAEKYVKSMTSAYNEGGLTLKQAVNNMLTAVNIDPHLVEENIFSLLSEEMKDFTKDLEDGDINLTQYLEKVRTKIEEAGLWGTKYGKKIWQNAIGSGYITTGESYQKKYNNLIAQQDLVDWGMTEGVNNAAEYKLPLAQEWYGFTKANLDDYVKNYQGNDLINDATYQTLLGQVQTAKDNLKGLADEHIQFSLDWITHEESMNRLTYAEKIDAYDRILARIESGYYRNMFANEEEYIKWQKEQAAELRQNKIDAAQAEAQQYADILKEKLEDEKAYYENLKSIREKSFDASQTIRESQYELNKELQKSLTMYEYLDEETRKLIFNEEDYVALTKELSGIQTEINDLTSTYESKIASATTEEAELLTAEYEAQIELKLKEFEIAKANLEITKKQLALQNTLNERNTRMFINGQWTWVANQEEVAKAREELAEAEFDAETATLEYQHEQAMNQLDSAINDIQRDMNEIDQALEDLEKILNGEDGLNPTLEDLAAAVTKAKNAYNQDDQPDKGKWKTEAEKTNVDTLYNYVKSLGKSNEAGGTVLVKNNKRYVSYYNENGKLYWDDGSGYGISNKAMLSDIEGMTEGAAEKAIHKTSKTQESLGQSSLKDYQEQGEAKNPYDEGIDRSKRYVDKNGNYYYFDSNNNSWVSEQSGAMLGSSNKNISEIDGVKIASVEATTESIDKILKEENELFKKLAGEGEVISIGKEFEDLKNKEQSLANALIDAIDNIKINIHNHYSSNSSEENSGETPANSYNGRIVTKPLLTWTGEDGPEAIIPLSQKYRDRGLSLWEEATKALGIAPSFTMPTIRASFPQQKENMNVSQTINVTVQNEDSSNDFYAITNLL